MTFIMGLTLSASAQRTMDVQKFTRLDNDLVARVTKPVRDKDEGKLCALIKVITNIPDLEVRPDALGIVQEEKHTGEIWLYVPYGARNLTFASEGFFPVIYQYPEAIKEGTVYELRLSALDSAGGGLPPIPIRRCSYWLSIRMRPHCMSTAWSNLPTRVSSQR